MGGTVEGTCVRTTQKKTASKFVQSPQKRQQYKRNEKKVGSGRPKITKQKGKKKGRILLLKAFRGKKG